MCGRVLQGFNHIDNLLPLFIFYETLDLIMHIASLASSTRDETDMSDERIKA